MMPCIVQFCGHPYIFARNPAVFDTQSYLSFVAISEGSINVTISALQGDFDCMAHFIGMGLPRPCRNFSKMDSFSLLSIATKDGRAVFDHPRQRVINKRNQIESGYLNR